jgi:hypothetical protein
MSLDRCNLHEGGKRCALPAAHLCDHDFMSGALTMSQALSWRAEMRAVENAAIDRLLARLRDLLTKGNPP